MTPIDIGKFKGHEMRNSKNSICNIDHFKINMEFEIKIPQKNIDIYLKINIRDPPSRALLMYPRGVVSPWRHACHMSNIDYLILAFVISCQYCRMTMMKHTIMAKQLLINFQGSRRTPFPPIWEKLAFKIIEVTSKLPFFTII